MSTYGGRPAEKRTQTRTHSDILRMDAQSSRQTKQRRKQHRVQTWIDLPPASVLGVVLQRLYDDDVLKFEIMWSFLSGPKSLRERFEQATGVAAEPVMWTIRDANKREVAVKRGLWRFSAKWDMNNDKRQFEATEDHTSESSGKRGFSWDDGAWGAATGVGEDCWTSTNSKTLKCGVVDGSITDHTRNPIIMDGGDFWGHGNFNQNDDYGCADGIPCCSTYYMGGYHTRKNSDKIRNEMYFIPCPSCHCDGAATSGLRSSRCTLCQ